MNKETLMPLIRFSRFTGRWENNKLGDLGSVAMCKRIFKEQTSENGDIPFFKIGTFGKKADAFIPRAIFEEYKEKYSFPELGDILISASGTIGRAVVYKGEDSYFQDSNIIWFKRDKELINNSFLKQFYEIVKWAGLEGSTIKRLYNSNILSTRINLPKLEEQTKIGEFFEQLDKIITLQQQLLNDHKQLKKAMLQKMFPQKGESVPRVRFAGFNGDWREKELSELAERFDNLRIPITSSERIAGSTPYYGANGIQGYIEGYTHDGEFILVAEDGANDLKNYPVQHVTGKVWVNNHAHVLSGITGTTDNYFLMNSIKQTNIEPFLVGGGRAKLNANIMMKIKFYIPEIDEQEKVGNFFKQLDETIALHEQKLETYQELKKAMLQKMFV